MKGGEVPTEYQRLETIWRDPSTPTWAAKADAAVKLYGNGMGVIPKEQARVDMGYSITEREEMRKWDEEEAALGLGLMGTMYSADPSASSQGQLEARPVDAQVVPRSPAPSSTA
jgi:hypothetical protein